MTKSALTSRRGFLRTTGGALLALAGCKPDRPLGLDDSGTYLTDPTGQPIPGCPDPFAGGTFLGEVPFDLQPGNPYGEIYNIGWDARRLFDLASLAEGASLEAPAELFYVRTEYPDLLTTDPDQWQVRIEGLVDSPADVPIAEIRSRAVDQGQILLECSGNSRFSGFGLMSSSSWAGAPLLELIDAHSTRDPSATHVLVRGFDEHSTPSDAGHSTPGAAWVFPIEELADAFLATELGGVPLPPDNGAPVRLLVPGWYGCTAIKWVTGIELVDAAEPATGQMQEFASRVHQEGVPSLAADFSPARQQISAAAIRVEKWLLDGQIAYRVVGILWGGSQLVSDLRLHTGGADQLVDCFTHLSNRTWNLWSHKWEPAAAGSYTLAATVDDPAPQLRLDLGYYDRAITLDEAAG